MDDKSDIDVDLLEYEMERLAKQKDATIMELQSEIDRLEEEYKHKRKPERYQNRLTQLKRKRESAEIECHRALLKLHRKIQKAKRMNR